eukprot:CAMPEP_0171310482 /NCGR_PEP_ID=MMETSP0816-20121228/20640_1 /TAXON_ID=420281 /ORGANISM="Proboscia inermis, Strain CCAP1064/1" /LENGTH=53 /DNA_ID=CAMNT_0011794613 /DNA_START=767 /DNA_END=928 /DNA_ORIENTATION=+
MKRVPPMDVIRTHNPECASNMGPVRNPTTAMIPNGSAPAMMIVATSDTASSPV